MTRRVLERLRHLCRQDPDAAFVGGCVRDWLLGCEVTDLDVATSLAPEPIGRDLARTFGGHFFFLREADETARALLPSPSGPTLQVDLVRRRGSLVEDLLDRDFTINSLALPLRVSPPDPGAAGADLAAVVTDSVGGLEDLEDRLIRPTREDAFQRDPVRLLRGLRMGLWLGARLAPGTEALLRRDAPLLRRPSAERLRDEVFRLLERTGCGPWMDLAWETGLLDAVLEKVRPQESPPPTLHRPTRLDLLHRADRLIEGPFRPRLASALAAHLGERVTEPRPRASLLRWASVLLDLWPEAESAPLETTFSPQDRETSPLPRLSWLVEQAGALRLSAAEGRALRRIIGLRCRPGQLLERDADQPPQPLWAFRFFRDAGREAPETLLLHAALTAGEGNAPRREERLQELLCRALLPPSESAPPPLLTGDEVVAALGIRPGPGLARLLYLLREAQGAGQVRDRSEALALLQEHVASAAS